MALYQRLCLDRAILRPEFSYHSFSRFPVKYTGERDAKKRDEQNFIDANIYMN